MLSPQLLCDTYTLFVEPEYVGPFGEVAGDPFGEDPEPEDPPVKPEPEPETTTVTVLTKVRLSQSSGDRSVDAQGDKTAHQAILFLFYGISRAGGKLTFPKIKAGDKLAEGNLTVLPDTGVWTVKGAKVLKAKGKRNHMEVNLV